jgi:hypothetical protein
MAVSPGRRVACVAVVSGVCRFHPMTCDEILTELTTMHRLFEQAKQDPSQALICYAACLALYHPVSTWLQQQSAEGKFNETFQQLGGVSILYTHEKLSYFIGNFGSAVLDGRKDRMEDAEANLRKVVGWGLEKF